MSNCKMTSSGRPDRRGTFLVPHLYRAPRMLNDVLRELPVFSERGGGYAGESQTSPPENHPAIGSPTYLRPRTFLKLKTGWLAVGEKFANPPAERHGGFATVDSAFLQTHTLTRDGSGFDEEEDAWMRASFFDLLLFGAMARGEQSMLVYAIDFRRLKDWFNENPLTGKEYRWTNGARTSVARLVKFKAIEEAGVPMRVFTLKKHDWANSEDFVACQNCPPLTESAGTAAAAGAPLAPQGDQYEPGCDEDELGWHP